MKIPGLRWWVIVLIFLAAVLNYVDRQTLSALAPTIQKDLAMDDRAYANVVNIFLVAYTLSYLVAGKLADKLGTRASMFIFVAFWSISNMLTAAAQGVRSLGAYRFLLGLGEAGVWPAASKAVAEWFPARERALAIGLYTMGATVGATVAPYIVIPLATFPFAEKIPFVQSVLGQGAGWRMAFILTGAAGLLWLLPWLWLYCLPRQSRNIAEQELKLIEEIEPPTSQDAKEDPQGFGVRQSSGAFGEGGPRPVKKKRQRTGAVQNAVASANCSDTPWTWRQVFTCKATWLLLLGRLLTDPAWYFYQFWFPKYLNTERGLTQEQLKITWIVYAAAGVGSLLGGWLSGRLVKRGTAPASSRMWIMLGCACLMPLSPLVATVAGRQAALALTVIVVLAALAWLINISSIIVDVIPKHSLGTVFSVVAAGSTIGGIIMNKVVATMVSGPSTAPAGFLDQALSTAFGGLLESVAGKGYGAWFLIMAFLHPLAWLMLKFGGVDRGKTKTA